VPKVATANKCSLWNVREYEGAASFNPPMLSRDACCVLSIMRAARLYPSYVRTFWGLHNCCRLWKRKNVIFLSHMHSPNYIRIRSLRSNNKYSSCRGIRFAHSAPTNERKLFSYSPLSSPVSFPLGNSVQSSSSHSLWLNREKGGDRKSRGRKGQKGKFKSSIQKAAIERKQTTKGSTYYFTIFCGLIYYAM
jgi:hypothetical protein